MLQNLLARMAILVACATLVAVPVYLWLERRYRPRWPGALGAPQPAGRGAYRSGEVRSATQGRAPAATRAVALLHLVVAGVCTGDGATLAGWVTATGGPPERFMCATFAMIAVLCALSPLLIISARRLLGRDAGLVGLGGALCACAAVGGAAILAAGTQRLPRETLDSFESLWLAGALDVLAVEACALGFWVGARAATSGISATS
jgi:hypothetical protein